MKIIFVTVLLLLVFFIVFKSPKYPVKADTPISVDNIEKPKQTPPAKVKEVKTTINLSLARLRALTEVSKNVIYQATDNGKGQWVCDSNDIKSIDNTGTVIVTVTGKRLKRKYSGFANIKWFGARANDINFDNAPIIIKAINSVDSILFPANFVFTIRSSISISNKQHKVIEATGSEIVNRNYDARTFLFSECKAIKIKGGTYTRDVLPKVQNGKGQSTIGFRNCENVTVTKTHITRSPEMGIDNNIVIGGIYTNNVIKNCLRDGIYAHYSADLKYISNRLDQIKDDALSMHDYGLDNQKLLLHKYGYKQAGHSVISDNVITNCIQGISSIACENVKISNNTITNTVNAGICVFNSEDLYPNSTARVKNVKISNNTLKNNGVTVFINSIKIQNFGQIASGRSAIFIACNRQGKEFSKSNMRSSLVSVLNNSVANSAVNAITLYNIDGLILKNNFFKNCHSDTKNAPEYTGDIVEILNCSAIDVDKNQVIDDRPVKLHDHAYKISNTTGKFKRGRDNGFRKQDVLVETSPQINL